MQILVIPLLKKKKKLHIAKDYRSISLLSKVAPKVIQTAQYHHGIMPIAMVRNRFRCSNIIRFATSCVTSNIDRNFNECVWSIWWAFLPGNTEAAQSCLVWSCDPIKHFCQGN